MNKNKNKNGSRLGIFYRSNNRWSGPYAGMTFTKYTWERNPWKSDLNFIKNYLLKSRVKLLPVA
jgi:hypothetical protein